MKKSIFAVCDLEVDYAHNFMEYLNCKRSIPFEIQAFTSVEHLVQFVSKQAIEILLISDKAMNARVKELSIGLIIILSEGVHPPELDQYPSVYKYQSSDCVIREVMACYSAEREVPKADTALKKRTDILAVYSPVSRSMKTSFALTLGQILAQSKAVIYLNLEGYAGFETLFQKKYENTISDIIYYVRQKNRNLLHKISSIVESVGNMDYLPPAESPEDIRNATIGEWQSLLDTLVRESSYEVIILDLGDCVDNLFQLLDACGKVYVPTLSDDISKAKLRQMDQLLRKWNLHELESRIVKIKLPYYMSALEGRAYIEQLPYSELGDYVRTLLYGET